MPETKTVEELRVIVSANTKEFKTKITDINRKIKEIEKTAKSSGDGVDKVTARMSRGFAAVKTTAAVAAIHQVTKAVQRLTDAYSKTQSAQVGLESILQAQNKDVNQAKKFLESYTKDGLIPMQDAYTAYKSLASAGYDNKQTESILQNLKDAAAFGRQGSLSMGDAVKSAAEGIKNENSVLVDNAGVTKNLSIMWDEYAASIGKTTANLTEEEKRLATVNGLMRETAFQTGDAAKYTNTLAGAKAALNAQTKMLSSALGSVLAPVLMKLIPHVTALTERLTRLAERAGQVMSILFGTNTRNKSSPLQKLSDNAQTASAGLEKSAKKAKTLQKALLGIDEIHNLDTNKSDSSGSDSSSSSTSSSSLGDFKSPLSNADNVIDPKLIARAEELKEKLEKAKKVLSAFSPVIKGVAAAGAAALGTKVMGKWFASAKGLWGNFKGLKVVSSFLDGFALIKATGGTTFKAFQGGFKNSTIAAKKYLADFRSSLTTTQKLMIGAAGFTGSLVMAKDAFSALGSGAENANAKLAVAAVGVAALGTAMYAALGPIGAVVAGLGALAGAVWGYIEGVDKQAQASYEASESYKMMNANIASSEEIIQRSQDGMQSLQEKINGVSEASANAFMVKQLVDDIYALSEKSNKSSADMTELSSKVDYLNSLNIDGLRLSYDKTTGTVTQTKDSVYKLIEAMEEQAKRAALIDVVRESWKQYYQAMLDNETASDNLAQAKGELTAAEEALKKKQEEL